VSVSSRKPQSSQQHLKLRDVHGVLLLHGLRRGHVQKGIELEDVEELLGAVVQDLSHLAAVGQLLEHALCIAASVGLQMQVNQQQQLLGQRVGRALELGPRTKNQHLNELLGGQKPLLPRLLVLRVVVEDGLQVKRRKLLGSQLALLEQLQQALQVHSAP